MQKAIYYTENGNDNKGINLYGGHNDQFIFDRKKEMDDQKREDLPYQINFRF